MATPSATQSRAASPAPSSDSESPSRAGSGSVSASSKAIFPTADTTFKPAPYNPPQRAANSTFRQPSAAPAPAPAAASFDMPQSTVPPFDGLFIHPPFDSLPDNTPLPPEGMNYSILHSNPRWFLDLRDWITLDSSPESALRYPRDLEPPRPRRQKDLLLRCTFCPRTYAGVNAKSMWTRHVREKHRVILSKAWTDTATSAKRVSIGKSTPAASVGPTDVAPSPVVKKQPSTSAPPTSPTTMSVTKPRGKPGPKPKPGSPAKKKPTGSGKIVIPAQRPKPVARLPSPSPVPPPPPSRIVGGVVRKSASPPPPIGMLPPRMRAARKSFRPSQGPLEVQQALQSQDPSTPMEPGTPQVPSTQDSTQVVDGNSVVSTPSRNTPDSSAPPPPLSTTDTSLPPPEIQPTVTPEIAGTPPLASRVSEDRDSVQMDKEEVADILLMDVDVDMANVQTPPRREEEVEVEVAVEKEAEAEEEEDVDMELEDEEEGLHPPISVGGLGEPVLFGSDFGLDGERDPFSLSSRPWMDSTPIFSPAASTAANTPEVGRDEEEFGTPDVEVELQEEEEEEELEPPPLGRFKISSLAYLMDRSLAVSPPPSPGRSLAATPPVDIDMDISTSSSLDDHDDANLSLTQPPATMFAAMEDVFVIKMQNGMDPELKARLLGHLREQFGVGEGEFGASLAGLPERAVRQIMSGPAAADAASSSLSEEGSESVLDSAELAGLTEDFLNGSRGQVRADLDEQLQEMVGRFMEEMAVPLQDELTLQLRDEIIGEVAEQMREAIVTQGDEAQVEFEWRRRYLERQLWEVADGEEDEVIQHPLHHLFLSRATPADLDMDVRVSC